MKAEVAADAKTQARAEFEVEGRTEHGHVYAPTPDNEHQLGVMAAGSWDLHAHMYFDCIERISVQQLLRKTDERMMGRKDSLTELPVSLRVQLCNHPHNAVMENCSGKRLADGCRVSSHSVGQTVGRFGLYRYKVLVQLKQRCWPATGPAGVSPLIAELQSLQALLKVCKKLKPKAYFYPHQMIYCLCLI